MSMGIKMQAWLSCLALLLAAALLQGAAAESKCDPSSANCAGPVEGSVRTASIQYEKEEPYYYGEQERYGEGEYYGAGPWVWQDQSGLEGAKVYGQLLFNTPQKDGYYGSTNYLAAEEGYVPDGYGNSHGPPKVKITDYYKEFAYEGLSNLFTVDITSTGVLTLTNLVKVAGKNNAMTIILKSHAFDGYSIAPIASTFKETVTASITDGTIVLSVPEIADLPANFNQTAVWKLSVCNSTEICCVDGQYRKHGSLCRAPAGDCDVPEVCSGKSALCPEDEFKHKGWVCKHGKNFCDIDDTCSGDSVDCNPAYKPAGTTCPWSKDCDGCITDPASTLKYSRTGPKPYGAGYKAGEYGAPSTNWPLCVGKCDAVGDCVMSPTAATCCREDEEALPFEDEDEYYGHAPEYYGSGSEEEYYPKKEAAKASVAISAQALQVRAQPVHIAARPQASYDGKRYRRSGRKSTHGRRGKRTKHGKSSDEHDDVKDHDIDDDLPDYKGDNKHKVYDDDDDLPDYKGDKKSTSKDTKHKGSSSDKKIDSEYRKRKEHDYLEYQKKLDKEYQEIKDIKKKLTKKDGDEYKKVEEKKPEDKEEYKKDEDKDEYEEDKEEKHSSDKRRNYESDEDDVDDKKSKKDDDKDDDEEYEEKHEAPEQHHEVDMPLSCWS